MTQNLNFPKHDLSWVWLKIYCHPSLHKADLLTLSLKLSVSNPFHLMHHIAHYRHHIGLMSLVRLLAVFSHFLV